MQHRDAKRKGARSAGLNSDRRDRLVAVGKALPRLNGRSIEEKDTIVMNIPGFVLIRELGEGGFGKVYQAYAANGLQVAIKVLKNQADPCFKRFVHEAQIMSANTANKHIVSLLSYDLSNDPPYLVMEYCDGGSLRSWVNEPRPWKVVAAALIHAARGLSTLHQAGGFHRDVKPDNLLLTNNRPDGPVIKLADFGLARMPITEAPITHTAAGTEQYMAPELIAREPMTPSADIFSLGVTGIELLTGRRGVSNIKNAQAPKRFISLLTQMTLSDASQRPAASSIVSELTQIYHSDNVEQAQPQSIQSNDGLLAGLLIGGALLGGIGIVAALAQEAKPKNVKLKL